MGCRQDGCGVKGENENQFCYLESWGVVLDTLIPVSSPLVYRKWFELLLAELISFVQWMFMTEMIVL